MKLKRLPEDFRVVELTSLVPTGGEFALYRLTKTGLGTLEAISAIARRWKLARARVAFGGLKDRHALTEQFLTIHQGPARGLEQEHLRLDYLGQVSRPFQPAEITGNRFEITLRDLAADARPRIEANLSGATRWGIPNYFDEQRFGSLGESGEFVARPWCAGDWERTLWLALVDPNVHDTPHSRRQKQTLREHWGNWREIVGQFGPAAGPADEMLADILSFLVGRPSDFRGAIARFDVEQRGLYLSSFQSYLWNRVLARFLKQTCKPSELSLIQVGPDRLPFFSELDEQQRELLDATRLPLPSARQHLAPGPIAELIAQTLAEIGLEQRQLRVKYPRDSFFSKGDRLALSHPIDLAFDWQPDELHAEREKLVLRFGLPRGSYATIVVKRITEM